jgi:hypothetical protein
MADLGDKDDRKWEAGKSGGDPMRYEDLERKAGVDGLEPEPYMTPWQVLRAQRKRGKKL